MNTEKRIVKNTGILMTMELGIRVLDAVVAVILARYLAPEGFGLLAFAISFAWLFSILPGFGMGTMVLRNMSRQPELASKYLTNGFVAKFFLAAFTLAIMGGLCIALDYPREKCLLVLIAALLMIFDTNVRYVLSFFQAAQRMTTIAVTNLLVRTGWVVGSLTIVLAKGGIVELLSIRMIVTFVALVSILVLLDRRLQRIKWSFDPRFMLHILKNAFPFALFRLYGQVYTDVDTVMLSTMAGDAMTGFYAASNKIIRLFKFIPRSLSGAVLPALANRSREDVTAVLRKCIKYLMIIALSIAGGITLVAKDFVTLVYGADYLSAVPTMMILAWSIVFVFANSPVVSALAIVNREREGSRNLFFGLLFSALSNLVMIPLYGHVGAATTTLLGQGLILVLQLRILRRELPKLNLYKEAFKPALAMVAMVSFGFLIQDRGLLVLIASCSAVYVGALILLGTLGVDELGVIQSLVLRKSKTLEEVVASDNGSLTESKNGLSKVMFLETSLRVGGTETVVSRLCERFDQSRVKPIICCLYETGPLGERLIEQGFKVYSGLAKNRWDPRLPFRLYRVLKQEQVDVLLMINQPIIQLWGTICAVLARVPVRVAAIRSTGKINRIRRRLLINRITFPWMTRVTALSEMHKAYLIETEKIDSKKIEIISNGIDLGQFQFATPSFELRRSLGIPQEAPVVGIVAMLRPEKAHDVFVKAAKQVLERVPEARFLIVGDGPERRNLEDLVEALGIQASVHLLGSRSDVPTLVNLFDVAVLSSNPVVETVSNSVLEYMAAEKPVVSTRVGSLPEMIDQGKTGFLVTPGNWLEMADKITMLLKDQQLARQMGEAGRAKIEKEYSVDRMVGNWTALFDRLKEREEVLK